MANNYDHVPQKQWTASNGLVQNSDIQKSTYKTITCYNLQNTLFKSELHNYLTQIFSHFFH